MLPTTPDRAAALGRLGGQANSPAGVSPAGRARPVWKEVREQVLTQQGLTGSGVGLAPPEPTVPPSKASPSDAVFGMLDRNADGVISRSEWNQAMSGPSVPYGVGMRPAPGSGRALSSGAAAGTEPIGGAPAGGAARTVAQGDLAGMRRNLAAQSFRVQALASEESPERLSARASSSGAPRASMQELRRGIAAARQEQELQVAFVQDAVREAELTRSSLSTLSAERDRLQRQVQEMRGQVAETKSELASQNEQHRLQTADLRATVRDLQSEAARVQSEQRRQAKFLTDMQSRKGADGSPTKFVRQVDDVKGVVAAQEQKLARMEESLNHSTSSQRSQLQEALAQGKQLSKALEAEAQRHDRSIGELQQLILQERQRDGGMSTKLHTELTRATQAMQEQTSNWMELAGIIKGEVHQLASELRVDRENRAVEASSQRYEITRMLEETRLANVASTVGSYAPGGMLAALDGDLGTDMMSRAGAVAVHKMVDTTKALLHGLEEALILRAGYIAGVFHTWRCEVTLLKVARRYSDEFTRHQDEWSAHFEGHRRAFEDELRRAAEHHLTHKEIVRQRTELLIEKWAHGEAAGLKRECALVWHRYAAQEKRLKRSAESIHKACYEWVEGKSKALKHSTFASWKHLTITASAERKAHGILLDRDREHERQLSQALSAAERKIADGMEQLEARHKSAKRDLEIVIAKWERGSRRGLLTATWQAFGLFLEMQRQRRKSSAVTQQAVTKFLGGSRLGLLKSVFGALKQACFHSRELEAERRRLEMLFDNERAQREREAKEAQDAVRRKKEKAHNAVEMLLMKWQMGNQRGTLKETWQVWSRFSLSSAERSRRSQAVHLQIEKWVEGDKRGRLHSCFLNWKHLAQSEAAERKREAAVSGEQARLQRLLVDQRQHHETELERLRNKAQQRRGAAKAAVDSIIRRWDMGDKKGLMDSALRDWCETVKNIKAKARQRNAVHAALLRSLEGANRANLQLAFTNWKACNEEERRARREEDQIAREKAHWEDREKQLISQQEQAVKGVLSQQEILKAQAHAQAEMLLKRWLGGDVKGTLGAVLIDWRRLKDAMKDRRRRQKSVQDSVMRFVLGEQRGITSTVFKSWYSTAKTQAAHRETVERLRKQVDGLLQKHELHLAKYYVMLGSEEGIVLAGLVFNAWREVSKGVKSLETEREREVALEEAKRAQEIQAAHKLELKAKAALAMGAKGGKILLFEIFLAWKIHWEKQAQEQAHRLNHNKAMKEFATQQIMKQWKKDAASLKAATFAEWRHEGKLLRHELAHLDAEKRLEEHGVYAEQLQARMTGLEEQLWAAYRQIDHITETLQKELQTKAELTDELRQAYDKMRQSAFTPVQQAFEPTARLQTTGMSSRPSSAQSRSHSTGRLDRRGAGGVGGLNGGRGDPPAEAVFNMLDRNHDGVITRSEWNKAMTTGSGELAALVSPPTTTFQRPSSSGGPPRPISPRCDWDEVIKKMKAERLLHAQQD